MAGFVLDLRADDSALWKEFGLVRRTTNSQAAASVTVYEMKDLTGALAAWEWQRSPAGRPCHYAAFCTVDAGVTTVAVDNFVLSFGAGKRPLRQADVDAAVAVLPNKKETSLPALLTFLPREGLVPESARYVLGPVSLSAFAPELADTQPGFEQGAEAQVAQYGVSNAGAPARLALFYYATPEMGRLHSVRFRLVPGAFVKRSGVLVAVVYGAGATQAAADTLLSRVQYEAKITWNDIPPPPPIKPLYRLLVNIAYMCGLLGALCLAAGLIYGGMRIYRRRFGQLEADEQMTTLHLGRDVPRA